MLLRSKRAIQSIFVNVGTQKHRHTAMAVILNIREPHRMHILQQPMNRYISVVVGNPQTNPGATVVTQNK
jgi:hypothetical protein